MPSQVAIEAVSRLAKRDTSRTEADVQADVYLILTAGGLNLDESQVARLEVGTADGTRRRLDVEIGHCVIELKRDLRPPGIRVEAEKQLAAYVETQTNRLGSRYVGVLTDGTDWYLYRLNQGTLTPVSELHLSYPIPDADKLLVWLEAILATQEAVVPSPLEIDRRLGAQSPAHDLDYASLKSLYDQARAVPEVALKRDLWAKLLRTAFGKAFDDDESLFINHTLLVLTAEIIAHAVIGYNISRTGTLTPRALVSGTAFANSQIHGVVEADFFDWVLHTPGGNGFVVDLADRVARFNWAHVEHDVLKLLYESIIAKEARASLGEYYTPDWLADRTVAAAVTSPLTQRVLDPSCGSGTFIFHAIRAFLKDADKAKMSNGEAISVLSQQIYGMDIHPVAVTLARVTYLLAIGAERLSSSDRGPINIPIYLGDSLQWEQRRDLLGWQDVVTIATAGDDLVEGPGTLFGDDLVFPRSVLQDARSFDQLVTRMADKASDSSKRSAADIVRPIMKQFGIHENDVPTLTQTFETMRRLHSIGRDHIWGYYVRNLIRPIWLAEASHHVDVLIGNPPWLRYSKMLASMQERYKTLSRERGLLSGPLGASGRDLSTLFVARAVELYLKPGGTFGFVMPHGTLTRKPHEGFRSGRWDTAADEPLRVTFSTPWDLLNAPTGFPMVSCVVFGKRTAGMAKAMPSDVQVWSAKLKSPDTSWAAAEAKFSIEPGNLRVLGKNDALPESPYRKRFRQGAVLAPRTLLFAIDTSAGPLGPGAGRIAVTSRRSTAEKMPWRQVDSITATVERVFVKSVHLGETLLPFRMMEPLKAVLPTSSKGILSHSDIEDYAGLSAWWGAAEEIWASNKVSGDNSSLLDRIDFHGQLSAQLSAAPHRVYYTASGNTLAAARVATDEVIAEHVLYWAPVSSVEEAHYLCAVLNSQVVLDRAKPLQSLGLFGARHFDKLVFHVPIPTYDGSNKVHHALVDLAAKAELEAAKVDITTARNFKQGRTLVRSALRASGLTAQIEAAVAAVVPPMASGL